MPWTSRQLVSFLLGCMFVVAGQYALSSPIVRGIVSRCIIRASFRQNPDSGSSETTISERSYPAGASAQALAVLLCLFLASASITNFASLSSFPENSQSACAFVVAWSGITFEAAIITGLVILWLHLRKISVSALHSAAFLCILMLAAGRFPA